jgi:phage shock protein C
VLVGVVILLDNLDIISFHRWWHLSWEFAFPAFLIFAGLYFLARRAAAPHSTPEHPAGQDSSNQIPSSASEEKPQARVLHRSRKDKKIFGICAGLGEYFVIDPTIVRVVYVLFTLLTGGLGIVLYFLLYLIIPDDRSLPGVQE